MLLAIRLTLTYVYNSTYIYTFEAPMINVKPAQPELANRMAGKSRSKTLWDRGAAQESRVLIANASKVTDSTYDF